jgi:hypothetical protein
LLKNKPGANKMLYVIEESQLLRMWSVIRRFGDIREIKYPEIQSELLTEAQILLTAFVLELQPLPRISSASQY